MRSQKQRVYPLEAWHIKSIIPAGRIGHYILYIKARGKLRPVYAGRSDTDLRRRLLTHHRANRATHFEFRIVSTSERAYALECAAYHGVAGILNSIHPAKPAGVDVQCPFCWHNAERALRTRIRFRQQQTLRAC